MPDGRKSPSLVIYDFSDWHGSLVASIVPRAHRIAAGPSDTAEGVIAELPSTVTHFLFHLDLSVTEFFPPARRRLVQLLSSIGINTLNAHATDIRKPTLHRFLARAGLPCAAACREGPDSELLIIKTSLNFGGLPEASSPSTASERRAQPGQSPTSPHLSYRVMKRKLVPRNAWRNPHLAIETFVRNRGGIWWRIAVAQSRLLLLRLRSRALIKRLNNSRLDRIIYASTSDPSSTNGCIWAAAVALQRAMHLDYGVIDVMTTDDDAPYIVDVNTTPFLNRHFLSRSAFAFLRSGLTETTTTPPTRLHADARPEQSLRRCARR